VEWLEAGIGIVRRVMACRLTAGGDCGPIQGFSGFGGFMHGF